MLAEQAACEWVQAERHLLLKEVGVRRVLQRDRYARRQRLRRWSAAGIRGAGGRDAPRARSVRKEPLRGTLESRPVPGDRLRYLTQDVDLRAGTRRNVGIRGALTGVRTIRADPI